MDEILIPFIVIIIVVPISLIIIKVYISSKAKEQKNIQKGEFETGLESFKTVEEQKYKQYLSQYNSKKKSTLGEVAQSDEDNSTLANEYGSTNYYRTKNDELVIVFEQKPQRYSLNYTDYKRAPSTCGRLEVKERYFIPNILYWRELGTISYTTNVKSVASDNSVNLGGAVVGAAIAGGAGAIIGSRVGTEPVKIESKTETHDTRKIELRMTNGKTSELPFYYKEAFKKLIPEKEYEYVNMNNLLRSQGSPATRAIESAPVLSITDSAQKQEVKGTGQASSPIVPSSQTTQTSSAADEILKFKQLLDMGVISQEEFEVQKNKLLGK